jgi:8-oxo-dGTP pyrophosphatase MutT (NUDIX family)
MTIFTTPSGRRVPAKLLGSAAVIPDDQGRVLLVKHSYGRLNWEIPGGLAELHESATENALREVREETGLEVEAQRLTGDREVVLGWGLAPAEDTPRGPASPG